MESGTANWVADPPWALITTDAHSPTHSWTDSPASDYANDADVSLTSIPFSLAGFTNPILRFWNHYALEEGWDYGCVEVSTDDGVSWTEAACYTGWLTDWTHEQVSLRDYGGQASVRIRFHLVSDSIVTDDGWYVDDVEVRETQEEGSIHGTVTYNGAGIPGIPLRLRFYDGASWNTAAETATGGGSYSFTGLPSLVAGQKYYVRYGPNTTNSDYLFAWYGPDITSYTAGESVPGGDFDIANVSLLSPDPGATLPLPITFTWQRRGVATDTYRWVLLDPETGGWWVSDDLGYADSFTLTSLPEWAEYGKEYGWYVEVYNGPDSFGKSFYYRTITFSATSPP